MANTINLEFFHGDFVVYKITVLDVENQNQPVDLTDKDLTFETNLVNGLQFTKNVGNGIEVTNAKNGLAELTFLSTESEDVAKTTNLKYYLSLVDGTHVTVITKGILSVLTKDLS
jgi:hypothetical protein